MVKFKFQKAELILQDKEVLDCLNDLCEKFVVVSIAKLSSMFPSFIKKTLSKIWFLRLTYIIITSTHISFQINSDVASNNLQFCERLGLETEKEHKSLPSMYCMPKLYYIPFRARFIIGST